MRQHDPLKVPTPPEQISAVNAQLLGACVFGCAAWLIWPETLWWWGLYPMSVMLGAAAMVLTVKAFRKIYHIRKFERDQDAFAQLGSHVKQAGLADADFLTRKGVIGHVRSK